MAAQEERFNNARSKGARHGRDASKTDAKAFRLCGEDSSLIITSGVDCTRTFIERCNERSRLHLGAAAQTAHPVVRMLGNLANLFRSDKDLRTFPAWAKINFKANIAEAKAKHGQPLLRSLQKQPIRCLSNGGAGRICLRKTGRRAFVGASRSQPLG